MTEQEKPSSDITNIDKKETGACGSHVADGFVRYNPQNLPYEKLQLCIYLSELPELTAEDVKYSQEYDARSSALSNGSSKKETGED